MYPLIKVREVTASKIYLLKIALSSLVRIIWADSKKEMDTASTFYLSIKCSIIHINTDSGQKQKTKTNNNKKRNHENGVAEAG